MSTRSFILKLFVAVASLPVVGVSPIYAQSAPVVVLDSFESGSLHVINPNETAPDRKYLWSQYPGCKNSGVRCIGSVSITSAEKFDGEHSLQTQITENNAYLQFYPYSIANRGWGLMHNFLNSGVWKTNTYNRMRIWIKTPLNLPEQPAQYLNLHFGTYFRHSKFGDWHRDAEAEGNHFYHFYNVPATTEWYQIVVDTHPSHQRGGSGATEWGDKLHPTGERNWNYFDAMTRFYLDFYNNDHVLPSTPADFFFDGFAMYQEANPVNIEQVYSLGGVYVPSSNRIRIGWQHEKGDGRTCHEVRYAFQDVFTLPNGWDSATPAPTGTVCPRDAVYAGMVYDSTDIDVSEHTNAYIAIKPQNSDRFNQITIPLRPR